MTAQIVNLRRARKAKARAERHTAAAEARARHGERRVDKDRRSAEDAIAARRLEGARRDEP